MIPETHKKTSAPPAAGPETATYAEAEDERLALSLGADAFLLKPTEPQEFLVRIREFDNPVKARIAPKPISVPEEGQQSALDENGVLRVYSEALIRKLEERMLQLGETNRELRASEEGFRTFMDHCPAAAFIKDGSGQFAYTNPAWRKQFATEPTEWLEKTDFDFWPQESAELFRKSDQDCLIQDGVIQTKETAKLPNGSERSWIVMKYPVETGHGRGIGCMAWDVTEQRSANEKLREQATLLDKAQDAILVQRSQSPNQLLEQKRRTPLRLDRRRNHRTLCPPIPPKTIYIRSPPADHFPQYSASRLIPSGRRSNPVRTHP